LPKAAQMTIYFVLHKCAHCHYLTTVIEVKFVLLSNTKGLAERLSPYFKSLLN